jgi:DNA-binding GntR family transcriptional regulator
MQRAGTRNLTGMEDRDAPRLGQQRVRSLADAAFEAIEEMIVTRRLAPGAMVSESELAAELSMGRTPVREALARLEWIGFVEVHPRRGVQVSGVDVIRHLELLEVRRPLEASMVRHVVERATSENLEDIQRWARALIEAAAERSRDRYFQAKRKLHEVEVRAAHNHVLSQTMSNLHAQSRRFWFTYEPTESFLEAAEHHGAIVDRIVNRDAEAAVAAVESLFAFLERLTKRALDRRPIF